MTDPETTRVGSQAHYEDPAYYDQAYRRRREDVRFYADLAEERGGPVLELGCGTGRVSLALAERGVEVLGVDAMAPMLARAEERLAKRPARIRERLSFRRGDLRALRLKRRFPLVIAPFNVFMHLYTRRDVERALATVKRHLRRGGRFAFDVRMPDARELARDPERVYKAGKVTRPETGRRYHYRERFAYDPVDQIQTIEMAFVGDGDPLDFHMTPLTHRQFYPAELEALLHYNGFTLLERWGDFERGPLDEASESQVLLCRARGQ